MDMDIIGVDICGKWRFKSHVQNRWDETMTMIGQVVGATSLAAIKNNHKADCHKLNGIQTQECHNFFFFDFLWCQTESKWKKNSY